MNHPPTDTARARVSEGPHPMRSTGAGGPRRTFPLTDLPTGLVLVLVALGVPRTVLADLDVVPPESGPLYYVVALTPFAVWLVAAVARRSVHPVLDHVIVGLLYGISLVVVHQLLWAAGPSLGHNPPQGALEFAQRFDPALQDLALRVYTSGIALAIGLGCGLVMALAALAANTMRSRGRQDGAEQSTR